MYKNPDTQDRCLLLESNLKKFFNSIHVFELYELQFLHGQYKIPPNHQRLLTVHHHHIDLHHRQT